MKHYVLRYFGQPGNSWRYALAHDYGFHTRYLRDVHFENKWLTIKDGDVVIKAGYAWDGCSPCVSVLGLFYLGPPDGAQLLGIPATYHASLVHDVLCQFRHDVPILKATSVAIFRELLDKARFPLARLYATAVALFGPRNFRLDSSSPNASTPPRGKVSPKVPAHEILKSERLMTQPAPGDAWASAFMATHHECKRSVPNGE